MSKQDRIISQRWTSDNLYLGSFGQIANDVNTQSFLWSGIMQAEFGPQII